MKNYFLAYVSGAVSAIIFGLSFLFTKNALDSVNPFYFMAYRFGVAFITINLLLVIKIIKIRFTAKTFRDLLPLTLVQPIVYFIFETSGVSLTESSEAGVIIATLPIFTLILSNFLLKEKVNLSQILSILVALAGIIVITISRGFKTTGNIWGPVLLLLATLSAGFYNIMSRKASARYTPWEITYHMMFTGAVGFSVIATSIAITRRDVSGLLNGITRAGVLIPALYLGILSSMEAFCLINYALSKIEATRSSVFSYLSTVVAIIAGVLFRKEILSIWDVTGSSFILLGIWGTNAFQRFQRQRAINGSAK